MYFCVVLCIVCFVLFAVLFVCICVLNYCHRVAAKLQLNISYDIVLPKFRLHVMNCLQGGLCGKHNKGQSLWWC